MKQTVVNEFVTKETERVGERMMQMIKAEKIRNHKLGNTSVIHHGALEEKELGNYKKFLLTRNFYNLEQLTGRMDYE